MFTWMQTEVEIDDEKDPVDVLATMCFETGKETTFGLAGEARDRVARSRVDKIMILGCFRRDIDLRTSKSGSAGSIYTPLSRLTWFRAIYIAVHRRTSPSIPPTLSTNSIKPQTNYIHLREGQTSMSYWGTVGELYEDTDRSRKARTLQNGYVRKMPLLTLTK